MIIASFLLSLYPAGGFKNKELELLADVSLPPDIVDHFPQLPLGMYPGVLACIRVTLLGSRERSHQGELPLSAAPLTLL